MDSIHLFAGAGGGILADILLGHRPVCAVEIDDYCRRVLVARQDDGSLPPFPIWDDVTTFDGAPWRGLVDVVSGGFPCQDISSAGAGAGLDGARSGLWSEFVRVVRDVGPRWWFVENSPMLTSRGLGRVLSDMAALGYDAEWCVLGAKDVGAPHKRDRIWILAHSDGDGEHVRAIDEKMAVSCPALADTQGARRPRGRIQSSERLPGQSAAQVANTTGTRLQRDSVGRIQREQPAEEGWWLTEPALDRVAHGVADRMVQLKAIGNGQVPQCAALAWRTLYARLMA